MFVLYLVLEAAELVELWPVTDGLLAAFPLSSTSSRRLSGLVLTAKGLQSTVHTGIKSTELLICNAKTSDNIFSSLGLKFDGQFYY